MEIGPDPSTAVILADGKKPPMAPPSKNKKKHGALRLLQAALFMWRRRGSSKRSKATLQIEVASASAEMLNKVVGSMRPLHAKGGESPPHVAAGPVVAAQAQLEPAETLLLRGASPARSEQYEDVASGSLGSPSLSMTRPDASPSHCSSASDWAPSCFSSALNLQELVKGEEGCDTDNDDDDNDEDADNGRDCNASGGDEMIDQKAEEFIAQFYEQMRIQNYNESVRRSARHSW